MIRIYFLTAKPSLAPIVAAREARSGAKRKNEGEAATAESGIPKKTSARKRSLRDALEEKKFAPNK